MTPQFILDPRIAADSLPVADLSLSAVRLMRDANFPWLLLTPRRPGLVEILDLATADQTRLMDEIRAAGEALRATVACDKLNIAAIGNVTPQLHVHVIARRRDDIAWPKPVWGHAPAKPYAPGEAKELIARLAARLREADIVDA